MRPLRPLFATGAALLVALSTVAPAAAAPTPSILPPTAPAPTSTGASPGAPDPHPPAGGIGPDGQAVGGARLLSRGLVAPSGAPTLPKGLMAHGWVLADLSTGEILAARDPHGRYQPASILKALTCQVLLPRLPGNRVVTASTRAANAEGSAVGLVPGGKYTVDTLFRSLLMMSGNDAATALAEAAGGVGPTVRAMNTEAQALGMYDTFVQTPSGLDGWQQLTSAYDMAVVLRQLAHNPRFLAYDRTAQASLPPETVGARKWGRVPLYNQEQQYFDTVPGASIAKTGFTDAAQHTFLGAATEHGRTLGVVFLRAQRYPTDQWQQAQMLLRWGFSLPSTVTPVGSLDATARSAPGSPSPSTSGSSTSGVPTSGVSDSTAPSTTSPARVSAASGRGGSGVPTAFTAGLITVVVLAAATWLLARRRRPARD